MGGSADQATARSDVAAQSLFTAASAANAIPIAGQFVSAGLAIAGMFVKIFGGRRKRKKEAAARKEHKRKTDIMGMQKQGQQDPGTAQVGGAQGAQPLGQSSTVNVSGPKTPTFSSFGGGPAPSVQQMALNDKLGL